MTLTKGKVFLGLLLSLFILINSQAIAANQNSQGQKIITASAVQVRQGPSVNTAVLGRLKLGVNAQAQERTANEVNVGQLRDHWYRINDGRLNGWVFGAFLRDFIPAQQEAIWLDIARARSTNKNLRFADYADTYGFITSILPKVREQIPGVELEFNRMLVLQRSLDTIKPEQNNQQPYKGWLAMHSNKTFFDEISAQWLVRAQDFWALADRVPNTRLGDDIALFAANTPLGGECEGDIACNLQRLRITDGEYLKRYPQGRHVSKVLQSMDSVLAYIQQALRQQPNYFRNDNESGRALQDLLAKVEVTRAPERQQVVGRLQAIRVIYNQSR